MSKLYIIAGPNGAGKTTASMEYLKDKLECLEFINADNIAFGISPFRPETVAITAGKIMLDRIDELINLNVDFAIETTLSSKTLIDKIKKAKLNNFEIIILFYFLDSPELAIKRVENRVSNGGHNISEDVIRRRYERGLFNLFRFYINNSEYWLVLNNSQANTSIIAEGDKVNSKIYDNNLWNMLKRIYG